MKPLRVLAVAVAVGLAACGGAPLAPDRSADPAPRAAATFDRTPAPTAPAPVASSAPPALDGALGRPTSAPYAGDLSIFEQPGRAERLGVERVMDVLGIRAGSAVADVGAGSGWFTVRAARRVGPEGAVYAVEINRAYLAHIAARAGREGLANVRPILGAEDDPRLAPASVDAVLLLKTYHELGRPLAVLAHLREAMRPHARLGIIDKDGHGDDHGLGDAVVARELERAGFELVERHDFVKGDGLDYFLVFRASTSRRAAAHP